MKQLLLLSTLLFSTVSLAQAPTITDIQPSSGPSAGGTEVTLTGTNLLTKVVCIVPCPARVSFGTVTVDVETETPTRLVVITPAHAPGTVDVTVHVTGEEPVKVADGFTFLGDADDQWAQLLLPVYIDGTVSGAFGSAWTTDFWLRNNGTTPVQLAPWPCPEGQACPPVYPLSTSLGPGATLHDLPPFFRAPSANPSRILYAGSGDISASLRVADTSRSTLNAGTDLPVIRDDEMRGGTVQLFNVPMDDRFRLLLRIYETAYTKAAFTVRLFDQSDLAGQSSPVHQVTLTATTAQEGEFRTEAAYAQFDLTPLLQLDRVWPAAVRIEIEPKRPGSRYWAVASITNNETQVVTLSTPQ